MLRYNAEQVRLGRAHRWPTPILPNAARVNRFAGRSFPATLLPPPPPAASVTAPTQVGPDTRTTRSWSEQVDDEEAEAAQLAAASSTTAAQEEIWTTFQDAPVEAPSPAFLPEPPVYTDVRQGPHRYSERNIYEGIVEEEPPSTDHPPDAATPGAMPLAPEEDTDAITHAFEPRGMSSFQNPFLYPGRQGHETERPEVYCLACYRPIRQVQWNMCPVCKNADSTVPQDDPLVPRCTQAQRLDDNTVVLGYELMLDVG